MSSGKRERKRRRKELVRRAEQQRRVAFRASVVGIVLSVVGLAVMGVLALLGHGSVAFGIAGPTGVVVLVTTGVLIVRGRQTRRESRTSPLFVWCGVVLTGITGVGLLATAALHLIGRVETAETVGVATVVPATLAVAFVGAALAKNVRGSDGHVTMSNHYFH